MELTETDIARHCGNSATAAGHLLHRQAGVVAFDSDGDTIRSTVKCSGGQVYRQTITLSERHSGIEITGRCTCRKRRGCEHLAAALFHVMESASSGRIRETRPLELRPERLPAARLESAERGLPSDLGAWLDDLARVSRASGEADPDHVAQRLIYVLMPMPDDLRMAQLGVQPVSARLLENGCFATNSRPYAAGNITAGATKSFRALDYRIMRELPRLPLERTLVQYRLAGVVGAEMLGLILATGRARWLSLDGPALRAGPARRGSLTWVEAEAGMLLPRLTLDGEGTVLAATPAVYVDPEDGLAGSVETGLPAPIAAALLRAPPMAVTDLAALNGQLARLAPALAGFVPSTPTVERRTGVRPVPCLHLFTALMPAADDQVAASHDGIASLPEETVALARLSFRYGDVTTPSGETGHTATIYDGTRLVEIRRDIAAEAEAARRLLAYDFRPVSDLRAGVPAKHAHDLVPGEEVTDWLSALHDMMPDVQAAGWEVTVAPDFPHRVVRADGDFDAELREGSGVDWLELHLGAIVDGERIDLIEPLVALIGSSSFSPAMFDGLDTETDADAPVFLPLADGCALAMPLARLRPMVEALLELALGLDRADGILRLSVLDAARLHDFEIATADAKLRWRGGNAIRDLGRRLTAACGIPPVAVPPTFLATLRPYQAEGVSWLSLLREVGLGGILADDMGLGKTVQALAFLSIEKAAGRLDSPALVVAPTSLMANWAREAERFAPALRVLTLHGLDRKSSFDAIQDHDVVLTTYPLLARDRTVLAAQDWYAILLDEAQTIKNPDAGITRLVLSLGTRYRFCLTGTPLENSLSELWSLFSFACPGLLGDRKRFTTLWRTPIEKNGDAERGQLLARRVRPFLLRRTKEEVARDLPPKTEMVERVDLGAAQRDIYESVRYSMHERIRRALAAKGVARIHIELLDALLKLRQVCCDPRLLNLESAESAGSAKLERLEEMLRELLAEGRRVLVFSQFTSMLDLIRPRLDAAGITYSLLTGSTHDRPAAIAAFDRGDAQVFLISLKAGGVGLNLVSADTVVLYDPWWNPAVEDQAIDRVRRIGQTKPVFVHKLVAAGTIEEKMEVLKEKKAALAASLFDPDGGPTLAMTEDDIEMLLAR